MFFAPSQQFVPLSQSLFLRFSFPKKAPFLIAFSAVILYSCGNDDSTETAEDLLTGESFSVPALSYNSADTIGEAILGEHEKRRGDRGNCS